MWQDFKYSYVVTVLCLGVAGWWGWTHGGAVAAGSALVIASVLGVLEISLSFDNAVVNARVLRDMDEWWRQMFLTVGILVAVFGMRLVFPIVIVSVATGLGWGDVTNMALNSPAEYAKHLTAAHVQIAMFGGSFLFLVFLYFMFDAEKEVHWIPAIERRTQKLGRMDGAPILMALIAVLAVQAILPEAERLTALEAGVAGIVLYMLVGSIDLLFEQEQPAHDAHASHGQTAGSTVVKQVTRSGFAAFLYLEVLDASFSFDGVIGAFAITQDVVIIMVGLAIGAMFVRSMTVYLVHKGTLQQYIYLEHGAHYAIGILALIMFASTVIHIPEVITGLIGVGFIIASVRSSVRSGQNPA